MIIVCLLAALVLCAGGRGAVTGGRPARPTRAAPSHIVVDTLNLAHWRRGGAAGLSPDTIVQTIDATAPTLKQAYSGKVVYVLKDRESRFDDAGAREAYRLAALRNGVYVSVASRYREPPAGTKPSAEHSSLGRDDFYMALLASRNRCAVLTADKLRDFARFRATIPPFYVIEYAFWRDAPEYEFVRPESTAYARLRRPKTVHPSEYFAQAF